MKLDLHIHSTASDGALSPRQIVDQAVKLELAAVSLADHESINGALEAMRFARNSSVEVIPAMELLTYYRDREIHLLGYYFDPYSVLLQDRLRELRDKRNHIALDIVGRLRKYGFNIAWEQFEKVAAADCVIGKGQILMALFSAGKVETREERIAIARKYFRPDAAYIEFKDHIFTEAVDLIRTCGGIPVLAHPGLIGNDEIVLELIKSAPIGLEVYYSYLGEERVEWIKRYEELALANNLFMTGGSDYHGNYTPVRLGETEVPDDLLDILKAVHR